MAIPNPDIRKQTDKERYPILKPKHNINLISIKSKKLCTHFICISLLKRIPNCVQIDTVKELYADTPRLLVILVARSRLSWGLDTSKSSSWLFKSSNDSRQIVDSRKAASRRSGVDGTFTAERPGANWRSFYKGRYE